MTPEASLVHRQADEVAREAWKNWPPTDQQNDSAVDSKLSKRRYIGVTALAAAVSAVSCFAAQQLDLPPNIGEDSYRQLRELSQPYGILGPTFFPLPEFSAYQASLKTGARITAAWVTAIGAGAIVAGSIALSRKVGGAVIEYLNTPCEIDAQPISDASLYRYRAQRFHLY